MGRWVVLTYVVGVHGLVSSRSSWVFSLSGGGGRDANLSRRSPNTNRCDSRHYEVVTSNSLLRTRRFCRVAPRHQETSPLAEGTPWMFMPSHSEMAIRSRGEETSQWYDLPGTSDVRCVATAQHHLVWRRAPRTVLVLAKMHATEEEAGDAANVAASLVRCGATVYLAQPLYGRIAERLLESNVEPIELWKAADGTNDEYYDDSPCATDRPDVVATIGGDGLLLYANSLFQTVNPPPLIAFSGGSLGFLAPFDVDDGAKLDATLAPLVAAIDAQVPPPWPVSLRMRLRCRVLAANGTETARHEALNEVVIDRGTSRFLSAVECFCNDEHLTTVQADGLIVATPTGSTAYSLAAGGPMLHPSAPAVVLTPICAHSLSFRPIVFPDSAHLRFHIQQDARGPAWVTFDGRRRVKIGEGDSLEVSTSPFPLPTLLRHGNTADWFSALKDAFNFNTRARQKPIAQR